MNKEKLHPTGICRATMIPTRNGKPIPFKEAMEIIEPLLEKSGLKKPAKEVVNGNLVVNTGRAKLASLLGKRKSETTQGYPVESSFINRLIIGNCVVNGSVDKPNNLTSLSDTALVSEIIDDSGNAKGKYTLDPDTDIIFPEAVARHPSGTSFPNMSATQGSIGTDDVFTDNGQDFNALGVLKIDQITVLTGGVTNAPVVFGIKEILNANQILIHNPNGFYGNNLDYRIDVPGTQVLFTKYVDGNDFSPTNGFASGAVLVHEAGLLFNDGTLFNRVVFRPDDNNLGVILMAERVDGVKMSVRFEWLVSF